MKTALTTGAVLGSTLVILAVLLWAHPIRRINEGLDRMVDAAPAWTEVTTLVKDPRRHETTSGEHPLHSLEILRRRWAAQPGVKRLVLMGNSQAQTMNLAPNEPSPHAGEKTFFDYLAEWLQTAPAQAEAYRLSAGGLSYPEVLWYATYLMSSPGLKPHMLVVQINYQSFWQGEIRGGLQELLADPAFAARAREIARSGKLYADTFGEATRNYEAGKNRKTDGGTQLNAWAWLENAIRKRLDRTQLWRNRWTQKLEFMNLMYRIRLYGFHLKPSGARSIKGARLYENHACLEALADLCWKHKVKLLFYLAPVNPSVNLFLTPEDRLAYQKFNEELARKAGVTVDDFEDKIPQQYWGVYYNSPDPLHLGRAGHKLFAQLLMPVIEERLAEP